MIPCSLGLVNYYFIGLPQLMASHQPDTIHLREVVPFDALNLIHAKTAARIKVSNHRRRRIHALNLSQTFDVLGAQIRRGRGQLNRARPGKQDFGPHVRRTLLQVVGHAARQTREQHHQRHSQSHADDADGRTQWSLTDI